MLATVAGFRRAFVPPVVLGVLVGVVCWKWVTDSKAPEGRSLDRPGRITIAVALTALLWGVIKGSDKGWTDPTITGALILAAVALTGFVVALVAMLGFIGTAYCVSVRLGAVAHLSALDAGMPFVILQLIPLLLAPVLSRMLSQVDARRLLGSPGAFCPGALCAPSGARGGDIMRLRRVGATSRRRPAVRARACSSATAARPTRS